MYNASKRLQAIRRQLLQMNEQYKHGVENSGVSTAPDNCLLSPEGQDVGSPQAFPNVNFMLSSPATDAHAQCDVNAQCDVKFNSMEIGHELGTIADCSSGVEVDDIPLSEELRSAISNMKDLDDVDSLVGNVISAVQVDTSYDKDLGTVEHTVTSPEDSMDSLISVSRASSLTTESSQGESSDKIFMSVEEEESWRKDRLKKDYHNIIERRRRYNINDRIKELATLLPSTVPTVLKQKKGSILKASVTYIKDLKESQQKLHEMEDRRKVMLHDYQKLLFLVFQKELKLKLYGLTEYLDDFRVKKKKRRLSEINAVVEGLCKQNVESPVLENKGNSPPSGKKNRGSAESSPEQKSINVKHGLRQHLSKKMAVTGKQDGDHLIARPEFYRHPENQNEIRDRDSPMFSQLGEVPSKKKILQSCLSLNHGGFNKEEAEVQEKEEVIELSTEQGNILLDLFENHGNVNEILINTEVISQPLEESPAAQECLSPVTSTSNMLEKLLRGMGSNSDSSGLEDSTESKTGLR